jgi:hypothetical protein
LEDQITIGMGGQNPREKPARPVHFWPPVGAGRETFSRGVDSTQAVENQLLA